MRAVQNGAGEGVDVARVTSDKQRRNYGIEGGLRRRDCGMPEGFAPTHQIVVSLDLHHENLEMVPGLAREQRMRAAHGEGKRDNEAFDRGDKHANPAKRIRIRYRRRLLQVLQPFREKNLPSKSYQIVGRFGEIFGRPLTRNATSSGTAWLKGERQRSGSSPAPERTR